MKILAVLLVVVAIVYGVFRGGLAAESWVTLSSVVSDAVPTALPKRASDAWSDEHAGTVRDAIVRGADKNGIALDPEQVSITEDSGTVSVRVSYSYPFVVFRDQTLLTVPISVSQSFALPAPRR